MMILSGALEVFQEDFKGRDSVELTDGTAEVTTQSVNCVELE